VDTLHARYFAFISIPLAALAVAFLVGTPAARAGVGRRGGFRRPVAFPGRTRPHHEGRAAP
jgi:hypothetical protein